MRDYVERFRGDRSGVLFLTAAGEPMASGNTVPCSTRDAGTAGTSEIDVWMLLGHADLTTMQRHASLEVRAESGGRKGSRPLV